MTEVIQRVVIPISSLPPVNEDGAYSIRYRVISEDQNRISHWSPIYNITPYQDGIVPVNAEIVINGNIATIVWENSTNTTYYDIFIGYGLESNLSYVATTNLNMYSFIVTGVAPTTIYATIQVASSSRIISNSLTLAEVTASLV